MPRQVVPTGKFNRGSFCGIDQTDIPEGGLGLTIDVDPTKQIGSVRPRNADASETSYLSNGATNIPSSGIQFKDNSNKRTIIHTKTDNKLVVATDSGHFTTDLSTITAPDDSKVRFLNAADGSVRVAIGKSVEPEFVKYIDRIQYSGSGGEVSTTAISREKANCFPALAGHGVVSAAIDGSSNWYFLLCGDGYLYKNTAAVSDYTFTKSDRKMTHPTKVVYSSIGYLLVLDDVENKIYIFNTSLVYQSSKTVNITEFDADMEYCYSFDAYTNSPYIYLAIIYSKDSKTYVSTGYITISSSTVTSVDTEEFLTDLAASINGLDTITYLKAIPGSINSNEEWIGNRGVADIAFGYLSSTVIPICAIICESGTTTSCRMFGYNISTYTLTLISDGGDEYNTTIHLSSSVVYAGYEAGDRSYFAIIQSDKSQSTSPVAAYWSVLFDGSWDVYSNILTSGCVFGTAQDAIVVRNSSLQAVVSKSCRGSGSTKYFYFVIGNAIVSLVNLTDGIITCYQFSYISTNTFYSSVNGSLEIAYYYYYKFSLIYDGYQESALNLVPIVIIGDNSFTITIVIDAARNNKRITGINIYSAYSTDISFLPETAYNLAYQIGLSNDYVNEYRQGNINYLTTYSFNRYEVGFVHKKTSTGFTYEQLSGIPETQHDTCMKYKLGVIASGYNFVTCCSHNFVSDIKSYLFRSVAGKPDTFAWSSAYAKLPLVNDATGIGYYNGRVVVFDKTTMIVVNAENLVIEDIFNGIGCISHETIVSTKYGLFWADEGNIYLWSGGVPVVLSDVIKYDRLSGLFGWMNMSSSYKLYASAAFDVKRQQYILACNNATHDLFLFIYTVSQQRWDFAYLDGNTETHYDTFLFQGNTGYPIFFILNNSDSKAYLYGLQSDTSDVSTCYIYTMQEFITNVNQKKVWNTIRWNGAWTGGSGQLDVSVGFDGTLPATGLTEIEDVSGTIGSATLGNVIKKLAAFKFAIGSNEALHSYELITRPLRIV